MLQNIDRVTEERINASLVTESRKPKAVCFERKCLWRVQNIHRLREETLWNGISDIAVKMCQHF